MNMSLSRSTKEAIKASVEEPFEEMLDEHRRINEGLEELDKDASHANHVIVGVYEPACLDASCEHRKPGASDDDMSACPEIPTKVCTDCMIRDCAGSNPKHWDGPFLPWPCDRTADTGSVYDLMAEEHAERESARIAMREALRGWRKGAHKGTFVSLDGNFTAVQRKPGRYEGVQQGRHFAIFAASSPAVIGTAQTLKGAEQYL